MSRDVSRLARLAETRRINAAAALAEASHQVETAKAVLAEAMHTRATGRVTAKALREELRKARSGAVLNRAEFARFLQRLDRTRATEAELDAAVASAEKALAEATEGHARLRESFLKAHASEKKRAALARTWLDSAARTALVRHEVETEDQFTVIRGPELS